MGQVYGADVYNNPEKYAPTPHYGDGGFLDSALNTTVYGFGGFLDTFGEGLGVIGDTLGTPDIGIGEGLSSIGKSLEYGRAPTRDYSWEDIKSNPWGYITDPQGLTSTIGMTAGNLAPDLAAMILTHGASAVVSAGARLAVRGAGMAGRAASMANKARKVTEGSRLLGALADGGKVVGRFATDNALGTFINNTSEAGQTYQDAISQGMDTDSARESAMTDFWANLPLSMAQTGLEMGMLKGVMKAPGRLASAGARAAEREGDGLMNAIANAGDKVADWSDTGLLKRFATRGIPGVAAEAYTEGLQNELENYSINDTPIEYNPFDMSDDSKTQVAQAAIGFGPMAFLGSIGHRRARRGESIEDTADQLNAKDQSSIVEIQSPDMAREELRESAEGDSLAGLSDEDAATLYDGTVTNSPIAINDEITSEADLPTDQHVSELTNTLNTVSPRDAYERSLYMDDKGNVDPAFEKNQALANLALQLSGQTDTDGNFRSLSVNPITENPHELKGEERKQAIQGLIQSQDFPEIQTPADAKGVIDIINGRAVDESNRAKANDLISREKALGVETGPDYINNAKSASPNVALINRHEEQVKRAEKQAKESQKNQEANVKTTRDDIKKDLRENGSKSIYYAPEGQLSESAQKELANRGVDISDKRIQNVINSESKRATEQDQKLQRQKVASKVQAIKDDLNKNGIQSEYMDEKNKEISSLSLSTNQQQQINNARLKALKKSKKQANGIIKDIKENGEKSKYLPNTPEARANLSNTLKGLSVDDRNRVFNAIDSVGKVKEKQSQPKVNPLPKTEQKVSQLPIDKAPQAKPENRKNAHMILSGSKKADGFIQKLHKSIYGEDKPVNRHRNAVIDSLLYPDKVEKIKKEFGKLYDQYKDSKVYDKALKNPDVVPSNVRSYYEVKDAIEKVKREGKVVLRKTERDSYSNEELKKLEDLGVRVESGDAKKAAEKAVTISNSKFKGNDGSYDAKVNIPSGKIKDWQGKNVELSEAEIDDIYDYLEKTHKITSGPNTKIEIGEDGKSVTVKNSLATGSNEPDGFRESLTGKEKLAYDIQKKKNEEVAKEKEKIDEEGKKAREAQRKRKQKPTKDETGQKREEAEKKELSKEEKADLESIFGESKTENEKKETRPAQDNQKTQENEPLMSEEDTSNSNKEKKKPLKEAKAVGIPTQKELDSILKEYKRKRFDYDLELNSERDGWEFLEKNVECFLDSGLKTGFTKNGKKNGIGLTPVPDLDYFINTEKDLGHANKDVFEELLRRAFDLKKSYLIISKLADDVLGEKRKAHQYGFLPDFRKAAKKMGRELSQDEITAIKIVRGYSKATFFGNSKLETPPQEDKTQYLTNKDGKALLSEALQAHIENTKDIIKEVFPNVKITNKTTNSIEFTTPNGKKITFNVVNKIFLTGDQLAKAKEEHGIKDGKNVSVLGYTQSKGGNIYVQLANGTGKGTVYHEAFHVAKMMGLSDKEIKALDRAFGTNEEVQANAYSDWALGKSEIPKSSLFKRIWNKIKDVAVKLGIISERTPSVQEVFSKIKSGEVIERNSTPMERIGKAQLKSEKEAVVGEQLKRHNVKDANDGMRGAILRGALDSILGSKIKQDNKLGTIGRFLKNPQEIFENYLPKKAKHIYELADEAYRKSRDKTLEYTQKYLDIRKGLNKSQVAALDRLILYADKIGRSPMQVQKIGDVYLALDHNGYIEHYKTSVEAAQKVAELKKSGEYKMVGSIQDTFEDAGSESKRGFTVYALSKGSSAFKSEESANAFAKRNYARAVTGALNQLDGRYGDQSYKAENIKSVINAFAKNEKFFDDIYNDSVRAAIDAGAAIKLPKKRNGYFPHVHLPYVVMEKDKDGSWVRTNSFYNALDAEEYVQNINRGAEDGEIKAKSFKMTPMDTAALSTKLNNSERLTPKQIDELREEGYLKESDDVAEGEYNNQLKKAMLSTIFKDKDEISVKVAMDRANAIMRKWKSDTKNEIHNRVVEMVKSQMKNTKLLDKLRKRSSGTITKNELAMLINNANMKAKFNPYFQGRLDNPETMNGFSKNVEDSTWRYLGTMANYVSKAKFKAEATASYKEMYGRDIEDAPVTNEQKFLKTYIKTIEAPRSVSAFDNLVNQVMVDFIGKIENRSGALGKFARRHHTDTPYFDLTRKAIRTQNYTKLGMANPSAMIVQAAQLLNANAKIGQNYLLKGIKLQGKSDKYADLFKHVGIDERSMAVEAEDIGHVPGAFEKKRKLLGGHSLEDVAEKSMYFFNKGDIFARKATAIGAYMKGKDNFDNLSKEKKNAIYNKIVKKSNGKISMTDVKEKFAMDYAKKTVTETNFDYSPVNAPQAFAMAGQTGKLFLQFQKYPLFTINFMRNNSLKENIKFLVPMLILTGATGMPAADLFDDVVDGVTGTSPGLMMRKAMINWAGGSASKKALVNVALYGAPTLAGINLSSRIGMGDALSPSLGPTYSTVKGIGQAVMGADSIPEAFTGVLKQIVPRVGQIQAAVSGDYKNSYGETVSHYSATDRFMKLLGFKPVSENNAADANKVLGIMKKKYTAEVAKAKKDYIKNPNSENYDALKIYGMTDAQIIKMLKTKDTTAIDTKLKSIPKKNKELQDLAKSAKAFSE